MRQAPTRSRRRPRRRTTINMASTSLLLGGFLFGLLSALIYAWVLNPRVLTDISPAGLGTDFKAEYLFLVSQSYATEQDWQRTQERLAALDESNLPAFVSAQLEDYLRQGKHPDVVQNLAALAINLGVQGPAAEFFGPTVIPPTATPTNSVFVPTLTPTLLPTLTPTFTPSPIPLPTTPPTFTPIPTATPLPTYRLLGQQQICLQDEAVHHIEVFVVDALLDPLPGVEVLTTWDGGQSHFFTGFQSDQDAGYGDFDMEVDVSYQVALAEGSTIVSGLRITRCDVQEGGLDGGWRLIFQKLIIDSEETSTPTAEGEGE